MGCDEVWDWDGVEVVVRMRLGWGCVGIWVWSRCYGKWLLMEVVVDLWVEMIIVGVVGRVGWLWWWCWSVW